MWNAIRHFFSRTALNEISSLVFPFLEKATGESKPIPYSSLLKGKIPWKLVGLPVPVKEPSNYGISDLKKILDRKGDIRFEWVLLL